MQRPGQSQRRRKLCPRAAARRALARAGMTALAVAGMTDRRVSEFIANSLGEAHVVSAGRDNNGSSTWASRSLS
jgi:hypothetical protein